MTYEEEMVSKNLRHIFNEAAVTSITTEPVPQNWYEACERNVQNLPKFMGENPSSFYVFLLAIVSGKKPSLGIEFLRRIGALKIVLPELDACYGVEQNPMHHSYDVYTHCVMACDNSEGPLEVRLAALLHDIGKPLVKNASTGKITFHKHEYKSVKLVRNIFYRYKVRNTEMARQVIFLVANHMYQYDRVWKDSTVLRFVEKVGLLDENGVLKDMSTFPLFMLRRADRAGRGLPPTTDKQADFEARIREVVSNT